MMGVTLHDYKPQDRATKFEAWVNDLGEVCYCAPPGYDGHIETKAIVTAEQRRNGIQDIYIGWGDTADEAIWAAGGYMQYHQGAVR